MKLSDAIMLGITRWRLEPRAWICADGGCLLGIGLLATGWKQDKDAAREVVAIEQTWPWLTQRFKVPALINHAMYGYGLAPFDGWPRYVQIAALPNKALQGLSFWASVGIFGQRGNG